MLDVYAVLGAAPSATWTELRHRYRARARELHPDVQAHRPTPSRLDQPRATALFTQLQQAWSLVATPERRATYDLSRRDQAPPPRRPPRPPLAPRWSAGPRAGVLLRTGPGDLHIAIPGGAWDLSLAEFLGHAHAQHRPPLLIGDLPPHPDLRQALWASDFVERHRLTTMVGLSEPLEERPGWEEELDDDGAWKLGQLGRAFARWARALPQRRLELPYAADLRLMGRLSLLGYEINLPHPAGLHTALEPRPADRLQARRRSALPQFDLRLPPLGLALVAAWAGDRTAITALEQGWEGLADRAQLNAAERAAAERALEGRRPRRDGHEPLPGSVLGGGPAPPSLVPLLEALPTSAAWLAETTRGLPELPWHEPLSQSGEDRNLSDAAIRLVGRVVERVIDGLPPGLELVGLRAGRMRFRVASEPEAAAAWLGATVRQVMADHLGFAAAPSIRKA